MKGAWGAACAALLALAGCGAPPSLVPPRPSDVQDPRLPSVEFSLRALGDVPWDGFTIPVVATDGSFVAVQTDSVPDWPSRLGTSDTPVRRCGSVTIRPISDAGIGPGTTVGPELLLGRCWVGGPHGGVVVESPADGGARRLGVLAPGAAEPRWLLDDGATNAGAWAVPMDDRLLLVWCRRSPGRREWSLEQAVFEWSGTEWLPCAAGAGPSLSADSGTAWSGPCLVEGLVTAIAYRDGVLRLTAHDASPQRSAPALVRDATLTMRGTREAGWQSVSALGSTCLSDGRLVLLHPQFSRLAVWSPASQAAPVLMPEGTIGMVAANGRCLWATRESVWVCAGNEPDRDRRILVANGTWILLHADGDHALVARPQGDALRLYRIGFIDRSPPAVGPR